jgi:hypothetical protein
MVTLHRVKSMVMALLVAVGVVAAGSPVADPSIGPSPLEKWIADGLVCCHVNSWWAHSVRVQWAVARLPAGSFKTLASKAEDEQSTDEAFKPLNDHQPNRSIKSEVEQEVRVEIDDRHSVTGRGEQPRPATLAVVKTWKDLQAQPAFDLGDGVKVRLGLEGDKAPQYGGVLLYCLTEGYVPANSGSGREPLGPVFVTFTFDKTKHQESHLKWGAEPKDWPQGFYLFVRALSVDRIGTYHLEIHHPKGKLLAKVAFECTKDNSFHPWMPWFYLTAINEWPVAGTAAGIALPRWDSGPIGFVEPGKTMADDLPTLLPVAPKEGFKISLQGEELVMESKTKFITSRPPHRFLARWWVNDKPFAPAQVMDFKDLVDHGRVAEEKQVRVPLDFMPQRVGATGGDKIGLQILYCSSGWDWCGGWQGFASRTSHTMWLSNKMEFTAADKKRR